MVNDTKAFLDAAYAAEPTDGIIACVNNNFL